MGQWDASVAEWYAEKYGEYPTNRLAVDRFDWEDGLVVVDIGCGTGAALRHVSTKANMSRLIGVEPIPRMIEIAKERLEAHPARDLIEFIASPAHTLPLGDDMADVVLAFDSFDHWGDDEACNKGLQEVHRILKPHGTFLVVKDGGIADAQAKERFTNKVKAQRFDVLDEQHIEEEDVVFTMWTCQRMRS